MNTPVIFTMAKQTIRSVECDYGPRSEGHSHSREGALKLAAAQKVVPMRRSKHHRSKRHYHGSDRPSFSVEQVKKFLHTAEQFGKRELAMFTLGLAYGLRVSEIADMKVSDINFTEKKITLRRLKGSNTSRQGFRAVNGYTVEGVLRDYLEERKTNEGAGSTDTLFLSQKKTGVDSSTIYRLFAAICEKAGIPKEFQHPHVLRHTTGQLLYDGGARLEEIQQVLGHRSINSVTIYARPRMDVVNKTVDKIFSELF
jgi:integrase/recombinase XerD